MTYYPLELSRSGDFVAGEVTLPRPIEPAARPALWTPGAGQVGFEDDFQMDSAERGWAVLQLARSHRHHQTIAQLVAAGKLTLTGLPGTTPSGHLYAPPTSWALAGLHYSQAVKLLEDDPAVAFPQSLWTRLDAATSTAELVSILEPIARLPQRIWDELDELAGQERGRSN